MKQGVMLLAATVLLACVCHSCPAAAAGPGRVLAGRPRRDRPRQQQDRTWLARSASAATMQITAVYDSTAKAVTQVKATADIQYCETAPTTTQCDILYTGICTGWFTTYDPCQAWPQYSYAPCGIQLKPKRLQLQVTSGGFDVWLDMRTSDRKGVCAIARRSRRMLQDPLDATISKPLIAMRPPTLQDQGQQIVPIVGTVDDSPVVNDTKPTVELSPKPEPLDSPKPYPSTEPQPGSSPFPGTWSSPIPYPWWWFPGDSPPPGFGESPKPYPLDSPDPNPKPLESPWPWFWDSPKPDMPLESPPPEPQVSPGMDPDSKPQLPPSPSPYWWWLPVPLPPRPEEDSSSPRPVILPPYVGDPPPGTSPVPYMPGQPVDKDAEVRVSPDVWISTPGMPDGSGTVPGGDPNNPIWIRPTPLPITPPVPGTDSSTTGPTVDGEQPGDETTEEEDEEDMLENRTDWPPIYMPTPTVTGGNTGSDTTTTDSGSDKRVKVIYDGGPCTVHMRFVSGGGATSCACFAGKTRALLGAKAMRAVTGEKAGPVFARWKCKGLMPMVCPLNACTL